MKLYRLIAAAALGVVLASAAQADIAIAGITEAQGGGAVAGSAFRNGYRMAIEEINAAGGLLGHRLVLTQFDIDTHQAAALEAAQSAVAAKPFAILGPVFSGMTLSAMQATATSGIPHFTGGEAATIARRFHPTLMRTSLSQSGAMPRLAAMAAYGLGVRKVALLSVDNEFGREGRALLTQALARRGTTLAFDGAVKPGQQDVAQIVRQAVLAQADALLLYLNEGESLNVLTELRKQNFQGTIVGEGPLVSAQVIGAAGGAAEGVVAHTGVSVDLPSPRMLSFSASYLQRYGMKPDHNAAKGYFAVQVIKVGLLKLGQVDAAAFMALVKKTRLDGRANPDLMTSVSYDLFGDLNRESYFVQVRGGRTEIMATMSSLDTAFIELANGRSMALNSNELRRELAAALAKPKSVEAPAKRVAPR
jgi:branched-chain amino acid transport system substrate-binding protein